MGRRLAGTLSFKYLFGNAAAKVMGTWESKLITQAEKCAKQGCPWWLGNPILITSGIRKHSDVILNFALVIAEHDMFMLAILPSLYAHKFSVAAQREHCPEPAREPRCQELIQLRPHPNFCTRYISIFLRNIAHDLRQHGWRRCVKVSGKQVIEANALPQRSSACLQGSEKTVSYRQSYLYSAKVWVKMSKLVSRVLVNQSEGVSSFKEQSLVCSTEGPANPTARFPSVEIVSKKEDDLPKFWWKLGHGKESRGIYVSAESAQAQVLAQKAVLTLGQVTYALGKNIDML
ncbi:hypothetical protein DL96DRAFT_1687420 [Flagelloscypha sp. PMI_526]|nr:hypothetical protein DL96DRAFT_1687420 [Flagelloscypha sp. PMI_526]